MGDDTMDPNNRLRDVEEIWAHHDGDWLRVAQFAVDHDLGVDRRVGGDVRAWQDAAEARVVSVDIAAAVEWMHELEERVSLDERALVPVNDVMAVILGAKPGPEFTAAVLAEMKRCRDLANKHYAKFTDSPPDSPALLIGVGFLQGTTFARAVLDVGRQESHG